MFTQSMLAGGLSAVRALSRRVLLTVALSFVALLALASPAHALSISVHSARIANNEVQFVVSTDVTHSCFFMRNSAGQIRNQFVMCLPSGVQQPFSMPLSSFPNLQINDTLVLETITAPIVTSTAFQFTGDLSLQSVKLIGGTQVEVVYTQSFPACSVMKNQNGTVISKLSSSFCQSGSNITTVVDRETNFTSIQPGQSVSLGVITRSDLNTNSVIVDSVASPLPCVLSGSSLSMWDRAVIVAGSVYVEDLLAMAPDTAITGNVQGRDDARMDYRARVTGNLSLIGTLLLERGTVTGQLRENVPVTQVLLSPSLVGDSTPNYTAQYDQTLTLPAGRYGNVVILDRARLRLDGSGAYSFTNLTFGNDAKLEINTQLGDFNIEADDSLVFGDRFVVQGPNGQLADGSRIFFYTNATTLTVPYDAIIRGQLWAPNANLTVRDRGLVKGCTRAHSITMGYDSRILQN